MVISPSSKLEIMHCFFYWIPYSLRNSLTKFENFINWINRLGSPQPVLRISIEVHYSSRFEFEAPVLVLVLSPSSELVIACHFFLLDTLFFKQYFVKFLIFFSISSTRLEPVQPNHCASLYGALILVILEPKSYFVRAQKL